MCRPIHLCAIATRPTTDSNIDQYIQTASLVASLLSRNSSKGEGNVRRVALARANVQMRIEISRRQRQFCLVSTSLSFLSTMKRYPVVTSIFFVVLDKIQSSFVDKNDYSKQNDNCVGRAGNSVLVKVIAALRILAYGLRSDAHDEYLAILEITARRKTKRFCASVVEKLSPSYLRNPTDADIKRMLKQSERRCTPGLLGSINCCKWEWNNCPMAFLRQFKGKEKRTMVILEAKADRSQWILHVLLWMARCLKYSNAIEASIIFKRIPLGMSLLSCEFCISDKRRIKLYWFADGIYLQAPMFFSSVKQPKIKNEKFFAGVQEAFRKNIERPFNTLQVKWKIIAQPFHLMTVETVNTIMKCVILYNVFVKKCVPLEILEKKTETNVDGVKVRGE